MMLIPHAPYNPQHPTKPSWHWGFRDGVQQAFFVCVCGRRGTLSETHDIHPDGTVTPSVWCDADEGGCGFHESDLKLEGYEINTGYPVR